MAINNKTMQPILKTTKLANENITAFRFIDYAGNMASDNERSIGVADIDYIIGENMSVTVLGIAIVESSAVISVGQNVTASAGGKARVAVGADLVLGRALDASGGSDFIRIVLVQ